jgi:signal transduction histidine kinase
MTAEEADFSFDEIGGARLGLRETLVARWPRLARLQTKLIVPYVVLTVLTALGGLFVVTRLVTSSVRERFVNQLFEASRVAADGIVRRERNHLEDLRLMAYTEGVREAVAGRDAQALQDLLWPIVLNNNIDVMSIVGIDGVEVISLARDPQTGQYVGSQRMMDFSSVSLVNNVLAGRADDRGDKFAGFLQTTYGAYLFTSAPIESEGGEILGAILTGTRLDSLLADLKTQSLADIVVLDANGSLVSASLVEPEEGYATLELSPGEIEAIDPSVTRELRLNDRPYQIIFAPLIVRQQEMGVLGVLLPSNFVVSTEATSRNTFSALFALTTAGVILVGYVLSQSIARPILRLRAMSQAVASGDLGQQTGIEAADEIGDLASAFDTMTLHLRERTEEAARLYAETAQRNNELAEINRRLQSTQQQLIQSEKLASVGQLTAGIVHDVKNPLAVIKGIAEELRDEPGLDPRVKEQMTVIRDNASRASTIVGDLLKFARQVKPEMKQGDVRESIEAAVRLTEYLARKGNVQVVKDVPARPVVAYYDAGQIEQVLINLIQNAIQSMPAGGTLRINLSQAPGALAVAVEDTGIGIPAENLGRIFDPFFTTKKEGEGTGLGLSVSYGIISRHGGRIGVESKVGKGTTFTILLPVGERPASPV